MDNKGLKSDGKSVQLVKGEAPQPQTLQVLEGVSHHATSNQGSGKAQKKRNSSELSHEQREKKRVADQRSKAKSREKQEEIKSQRDELETENKLLKQEKYETLRKEIDKLERENEQLKRENREKEQQFNSKLEELHSRNQKLEGELRQKDEQRMNLAKEKFEAEKKQLETSFELRMLQRQLHQSIYSAPALDRDNLKQRQSYTEQPELPALERTVDAPAAEDVPVGHLRAGTDRDLAHAGSDIVQAGGTDHAKAGCEHIFQAGTGADVFLADLSTFADFSSLPDFSPQQWRNVVQAETP